MLKNRITLFICSVLAMGITVCARADVVPLGITVTGATKAVPGPVEATLAFPDEQAFTFSITNATEWLNGTAIRLRLAWPEGAPRYSGGLVWLKDRNDFWHQYLLPGHLQAGATNELVVPFQPGADGWSTPGHSIGWDHRTRINPQSVGFRVFADNAFTGRCTLVSAVLETAKPEGVPVITHAHTLTAKPQVLECYEARFDLPDRYTDPFNPAIIDAGADIVTPAGVTNRIYTFYYQPHYRLEDELGEPVEPEGHPEWRIRSGPRLPGDYTVSLYAKDTFGETVQTNVLRFTAAPAAPDAQRFIRVSTVDNRYFETDDGALYYPI
ncbi:MAG: hypothetical protein J6U40_02270, partial [Kiritimatiellae bacterium]|nr:hypothetical protein [Kiritimatiellia bacterium]